jgi:hypothetical protein
MKLRTISIGLLLLMSAVLATEVVVTFAGANTVFPSDMNVTASAAKNTNVYICATGVAQGDYCKFFELTADSTTTTVKVNMTWTQNTGCTAHLTNAAGTVLADLSANTSYTIPVGCPIGTQFGITVAKTVDAGANCKFTIVEG